MTDKPAAPGDTKDPFAERTVYKDSTLDLAVIGFLTSRIANVIGDKPKKSGYDGFVEVSELIMRGRTAAQQKAVILQALANTLPSFVPVMLRKFFRPTKFTCFVNAWFASRAFKWLVGDMEIQPVEVTLPDGSSQLQNSQVLIKKCRYLEQSGCKGMCVNMCKMPVQEFIGEGLGMPLYMEPNFDDLSCKMIFGQAPPALEDDPVSKEHCFARCNLMNAMLQDDNCLSLPDSSASPQTPPPAPSAAGRKLRQD